MSDNDFKRNEQQNMPDGSYRYVRPESAEMLYRDANVEPVEDTVRMPRCYEPPKTKDKAKPKAETTQEAPAPEPIPLCPNMLKKLWTRVICMCLVCALLGGLMGGGIAAVVLHRTEPAIMENPAPTPDPLSENTTPNPAPTPIPADRKAPAEIYVDAVNQVVGITTEVTYSNFFGMTVSQPVSGTGFFISEDGYLLTNYHVVSYAAEYGQPAKVFTHDGTEYDAALVGIDPDNDIAVLQVEANGLDFATLGNSDAIQVGDPVYPVGNPLGELHFSMTTGSISATNRLISTQKDAPAINMFQIDAAVNNGNSGGPVYDAQGQVIGIVTAKYSEEGIEGLGFAIPINDAVAIATDLITTGYVTGKAKLGVEAQTMSARAAMYYQSVEGAYIRYIQPGSCADKSGLRLSDVIYRFGDLEVTSRDDLQAAIRSYHAGDTVELSVFRSGQHITIMVTLDEDIPETAQTPAPGPVAYSGKSAF